MHCTPREKHPLTFADFLFTETPQMNIRLLLVKKMYMYKTSLFFSGLAYKKETFAAFVNARAQPVVHEVKKNISSREETVSPAQAAELGPSPSPPKGSRRLGKQTSTRPSRLTLRLALETSPLTKKRASHPYEGEKVRKPTLGSGALRKRELTK